MKKHQNSPQPTQPSTPIQITPEKKQCSYKIIQQLSDSPKTVKSDYSQYKEDIRPHTEKQSKIIQQKIQQQGSENEISSISSSSSSQQSVQKLRKKKIQKPRQKQSLSTKNVPKNYINGFISYLNNEKVQAVIEKKLELKGYKASQFCKFYLIVLRTPTIQNLKIFFGHRKQGVGFELPDIDIQEQNYYSYMVRSLMHKFLQKESLSYFVNNKKMKNRMKMLFFIRSFKELISEPSQFMEIRTVQ